MLSVAFRLCFMSSSIKISVEAFHNLHNIEEVNRVCVIFVTEVAFGYNSSLILDKDERI